MPIFQLEDELIFPPAHLASDDGILAVGGDLSVERLLLAYQNGIFPWYSEGEPIIWWAPDPRFILEIPELKISKSMRQILRKKVFSFSFDTAFEEVITHCQKIARPGQFGTWITEEMRLAYIALHKAGYAHSVEVWEENELVGGLYGISLGSAFFGESMFARKSNASKAGFISLIKSLEYWNFDLIDCQVYTKHLASLGAKEISRKAFMSRLALSMENKSKTGQWELPLDISFF